MVLCAGPEETTRTKAGSGSCPYGTCILGGEKEINTEASKICVKAKCSGGKEQERGIGSIKIEEGHPCEVTCE